MIRVFVGCAANNEDWESQAVFEWSLRKHASEPVEITWMQLSNDSTSPWSGWNTSQWVTPFSGFRWAIPEICGFSGKAIYSDSDVIWMADVAELHRQQFQPGKIVMAKGGWRLCVSLWDCAAARNFIPPLSHLKRDANSHSVMTQKFRAADIVQPFAGNWNCLDGETYASVWDARIKAIHYTAIANQPQLRYAIPRLEALGLRHWYDGAVKPHWRKDLIALFDTLLIEASENGYHPDRYDRMPVGDYRKRSLKGYRAGPRAA